MSAPSDDACDRCVELPERLIGQPGADLGRETPASPTLVDDHRAMRSCDRLEDRRVIERPERSEVDDFGIDTVVGKCGRSGQRGREGATVGHEGDVAPRAPNRRAVDAHSARVVG
jgi:hypothetical protein